jgi:putative tryptophan/tyrosine transport system substrate-binding protein
MDLRVAFAQGRNDSPKGTPPQSETADAPAGFRTIQICPKDELRTDWHDGRNEPAWRRAGSPDAALRSPIARWAPRAFWLRFVLAREPPAIFTSGEVRRREFIALLGGAAATWPLSLRAQQPAKIPRIGIIDDAPMWHAFRQALRELGYVEGQNVAYEYRYGEGTPDRLAQAAAELVRRPVDVIATFGTPPTSAAKKATTSIPIVMVGVGDPVRAGLVASFARPGGNITGNTVLSPDLGPKRMQMLREAIANVSRVAFLINPDNASNAATLAEMKIAAAATGIMLIPVEVRGIGEFEPAFAAMLRERPDAVMVTNDPFHQHHVGRIIEFLARNRLPGMYQAKENVFAGGLMAYGASVPDLFRRAAGYVHRILQGTKPGDLPVELPNRFDLAVNLRTAKALSVELSPTFVARADEVIE